MADDSTNPFAQAAAATPRFHTPQPGTIFGLFDNFRSDPTKEEYAAGEARRVRDEEKTIAAGERQAIADLVGVVNDARAANPGAPSHVLFKSIVADPRFVKNALRVPAPKMTQFVGTMLEGLATPETKPTVLSEGQAAFDPKTGQQLFNNPKAAEADPRTKAEQTEVAKRSVAQLDKVVESGQQAQMDQLALSELERLGDKIGTGGAAAIRGYFSRIGIDLGDASDINAFESLVDRLTPSQRQGLPGGASDADVRMFRSSLPSLIRQPDGNRIIIGTLKAMNADRIKRAEIAESVFTGDRTVPEALRAMRALPNPMRRFQESDIGKRLLKGASINQPDPTRPKRKVFDFDPATGAFTEGE